MIKAPERAQGVRNLKTPPLPASAESPVPDLEPLLTMPEFCEWAGVSLWFVKHYAAREDDPLPVIGTARRKRIVPSEYIEWMRRNKDAA